MESKKEEQTEVRESSWEGTYEQHSSQVLANILSSPYVS